MINDLDSKLDKDYAQMLYDVKYDKEQFKDPEFMGLLMYRLVREREASNKMFKEILETLSQLNENLAGKSDAHKNEVRQIISEVDQKIIKLTQEKGRIDAETLKTEFNYKGKNAASARLNALYKQELLQKGRAGKKVYYWVKGRT